MLTPEQVTELKSKHGEFLAEVVTPLGSLVFKKPAREVYDRWADGQRSGRPASANCRELAAACLVFPEFKLYTEIIDALPGLVITEITNACTIHCGTLDTFEVKKL